MQLSLLKDLELYESRVVAARAFPTQVLTEAAATAPKWGFKYQNYNVDPRPEVLVLGDYTNEKGHRLVGGINLHYLSNNQLIQLRKALPEVMKGQNLKARYHQGKKALPIVFDNYYRTYNDEYIRSITPSTFHQWYDDKDKEANVQRRQKIKDKQKSWYQRDKDPDADAWAARSALYKPGSRFRQTPERKPDDEKNARYRTQRTKLADLEKLAAANSAKIDAERRKKHAQELLNEPDLADPLAIPDDIQQQNLTDVQDAERQLPPPPKKLIDPDIGAELGESIIYYSPRLKRYVVEYI